MVSSFLYIIFLVIFSYLAFSVVYMLVLSIAGRFFYKKEKLASDLSVYKRIAVLVPGYKEDAVILSTTRNLLQSDYPESFFDVYIIADSFEEDTLEKLKETKAKTLVVEFEKSTKTKSLNEAFGRITKLYDIALIFDADNVVKKDFLKQINNAFLNGHRAVQGRRVAKNLNTSYAILDACSEGINNHMFRKGQNALGVSACLIGSGMAFDYEIIKGIFSKMHAIGGFDKVLQLQLAENQIFIRYLNDALIFDEKVSSSEAFQLQRKRWISTQFIYLAKYLGPAFKNLFKGKISYFIMAVPNHIVLPRAFMLLALPVLCIASFFVGTSWGIAGILCLVLYMFSLIIAIPRELITKQLWRSVLQLPQAIVLMLGTLFHVRKANKKFIHTVHTQTEVQNTLFDEMNS